MNRRKYTWTRINKAEMLMSSDKQDSSYARAIAPCVFELNQRRQVVSVNHDFIIHYHPGYSITK